MRSRTRQFADPARAAARRSYILATAAMAAVALGMIEIFTTRHGRRILALVVLISVGLVLVSRPPVAMVSPGHSDARLMMDAELDAESRRHEDRQENVQTGMVEEAGCLY